MVNDKIIRDSKWVDAEWRDAFKTKGVDSIEPVPIDPPGVVHRRMNLVVSILMTSCFTLFCQSLRYTRAEDHVIHRGVGRNGNERF